MFKTKLTFPSSSSMLSLAYRFPICWYLQETSDSRFPILFLHVASQLQAQAVLSVPWHHTQPSRSWTLSLGPHASLSALFLLQPSAMPTCNVTYLLSSVCPGSTWASTYPIRAGRPLSVLSQSSSNLPEPQNQLQSFFFSGWIPDQTIQFSESEVRLRTFIFNKNLWDCNAGGPLC